MWSCPCTAFTMATGPGASKRTSTTYRSAGPMTTLSAQLSRAKLPRSEPTTLRRAPAPKERLKVRVFDDVGQEEPDDLAPPHR